MATYEDLFGTNGAAAGGAGRWMKWEANGEVLLFQQTGEPEQRPQTTKDGKVKWLVRMVAGGKVQPMGAGEFNPDMVDGAWLPKEMDIVIPGRVIGKKGPDGKKVEDFQPFDAEWETKKGDMLEKLKAEMLETQKGAMPGHVWALKLLDNTQKRHSFSVKLVKAAE